MPIYRTKTLGCKVNQYETREIEELLDRAGLARACGDAEADLVVVNTCVVTAEAARQCRQTIRRMRRENPRARLIVTGCYAAGPERDDLRSIDGVHIILADKDELRRRLALLPHTGRTAGLGADELAPQSNLPTCGISHFRGHTRAFVKIQDGCDQFCSYCIVPHVRPVMRSRPAEEVIDEVRRLIEAGHREIVLSGIHLGRYGQDLSPVGALGDLLRRLAVLPRLGRLRLSSIEVVEVDEALLEVMAERRDRICPHLHLPLQSGDDAVLAAMRRPYTSGEFLQHVERIRRALPDVALTSDVIVGFPGETAEAFQRTCRLCSEAAFSRLHVFPYSARPGTPAAEMPDQVPAEVKRSRSDRLRKLGHELAARFAAGLVGCEVTVLAEQTTRDESPEGSWAEGFQEHYVRTRVRLAAPGPVSRGTLLLARGTAGDGGLLLAESPTD